MNPTPEPNSFLQLWLAVGFIAVVISNIVLVVNGLLNRKQKREVSFSETPASKAEFDKHVEWNRREHENLHGRITNVASDCPARMDGLNRDWNKTLDDKITRLISADNAGREKLHDRINEVLEAVSELRGRMDEIRKTP